MADAVGEIWVECDYTIRERMPEEKWRIWYSEEKADERERRPWSAWSTFRADDPSDPHPWLEKQAAKIPAGWHVYGPTRNQAIGESETELTVAQVIASLEHRGMSIKAPTWRAYVSRGQAPKPARRVGRTPLWDADAIARWERPGQGARTDRIKETAVAETILDGLELPAGIHAELLAGTDAASSSTISRVVVWVDRPYEECPRCGEPVDRDPGCPAALDGGEPGGQLVPYTQQHTCGEVLDADFLALDGGDGLTADVVLTAAHDLAQGLTDATAAERRRITRQLREELTSALLALGDGEDEEDVCTGSEVTPGIYREDGTLIAWAYGPSGDEEDIITVTEHDVRDAAGA